jgi:hypothetical protein
MSFMKLPRRKLMALEVAPFSGGGKEVNHRKMPRLPSLGPFSDDAKVSIGINRACLFSGRGNGENVQNPFLFIPRKKETKNR